MFYCENQNHFLDFLGGGCLFQMLVLHAARGAKLHEPDAEWQAEGCPQEVEGEC